MQTLKLSIIICTYNRAELLPDCLDSLVQQSMPDSMYEVIVVNNNSTDRTQSICEEYAGNYDNFRTVFEPKAGLSHARNRGWQEARGEYVAYLDDDAKAQADWGYRVVQVFEDVTPKPVAVGGIIRPWYETAPPSWFADELEIRTWGEQAGFLEMPRAPYGFSGSNMAFPKLILQKYGGFSAEYGMVGGKTRMGEETDLFFRIYKDEPFFWYNPKIVVQHYVPAAHMTVGYRLARAFKGGISYAKINNKHLSYKELIRSWLVLGKDICLTAVTIPWFSVDRNMTIVNKGSKLASQLGALWATKISN